MTTKMTIADNLLELFTNTCIALKQNVMRDSVMVLMYWGQVIMTFRVGMH